MFVVSGKQEYIVSRQDELLLRCSRGDRPKQNH